MSLLHAMFGAIGIYWSSEALRLLYYDGLFVIVAGKVCIMFMLRMEADAGVDVNALGQSFRTKSEPL
jgi:hypothetical protein